MDAELCYDSEQNLYLVYRGAELVEKTSSYYRALEKFNRVCDQVRL